MEEELIDLRKYIYVMFKKRWLIAAVTATALLSAACWSLLSVKPQYNARAGILISRTRSRVVFDPRFQTVDSEQQSAYAALSEQARRFALVAMIRNGAIAIKVVEQLGAELGPAEQNPAKLLEMVSGALDTGDQNEQSNWNTDFLVINVKSPDPGKAAKIANAWAQAYEEYVNEMYQDRPESYLAVKNEASEAKETYEQAEQALQAFVAENNIANLDRLISEKQLIIDSLQSAREDMITALIKAQVGAYTRTISTYISTQVQNQVLAFEKEQQGKQALLSSYIDAYNQEQVAVFQQQTEDRIQVLSEHYAAKRKMELLLQDARALYRQVETAQGGSATNSLALSILKAQVFATSAPLPGELILQLETSGGTNAGSSDLLADLKALIGVIERRIVDLESAIQKTSTALQNGDGFEYLSPNDEDKSALLAAIQAQYLAMFEMGDLATLADAVPDNDALNTAIKARWQELVRLQSLESLPAYLAQETPLTEAIAGLQNDLLVLQVQRDEELAQQRELTRARDLSWETYSTLQVKVDELGIEAGIMDIEVRFASPAVVPNRPVGSNRWKNVALAGTLGFVLSAATVFFLEYLGIEYDLGQSIAGRLKRTRNKPAG